MLKSKTSRKRSKRCHDEDSSPDITLFASLNRSSNDLYQIHDGFAFELADLKNDPLNDPEEAALFEQCHEFGREIFIQMINVKGNYKGQVRLRPEFSNSQFAVTRLSFLMMDCSAWFTDSVMDDLAIRFASLFPPTVISQPELRPRGCNAAKVVSASIITTGALRAILMGLSVNLLVMDGKTHKTSIAYNDLVKQTLNHQKHEWEDYAMVACCFIELFARRMVKIRYINDTVKYGLVSHSMTTLKVNKKGLRESEGIDKDMVLLCGINLETKVQSTKLNIPMFSDKRKTAKNPDGFCGFADYQTGVFGVPYYINSVNEDDDALINVHFQIVNTAYVSIYDSEKKLFTSRNVQVVLVTCHESQEISFEGNILWKYHNYKN